MYDRMRKLIASNPILQFSKAADQADVPLLSDKFSSVGLGAGMGQTFGAQSDMDKRQARLAQRQRLLFGLMRFDMNKKRTI